MTRNYNRTKNKLEAMEEGKHVAEEIRAELLEHYALIKTHAQEEDKESFSQDNTPQNRPLAEPHLSTRQEQERIAEHTYRGSQPSTHAAHAAGFFFFPETIFSIMAFQYGMLETAMQTAFENWRILTEGFGTFPKVNRENV